MTAAAPSVNGEAIADFLAALAAKVPAPGGGATAGLHLAQAAALVGMVARYTTGSRYAEHQAAVQLINERADTLRGHALRLIDDDMAAFSAVIAAYKLPKTTPAEEHHRSAIVADATAQAASVPADVVQAAARVVDLAGELLPIANPNVISDVAAAADAARAAATTARVNVEINLPGITDELLRSTLADRIRAVDQLIIRADDITAQVRRMLTS